LIATLMGMLPPVRICFLAALSENKRHDGNTKCYGLQRELSTQCAPK